MSMPSSFSSPQRSAFFAATALSVALLTGGFDRPYAFGLAMALAAKGVALDVIGGAEIDSPEMQKPGVTLA